MYQGLKLEEQLWFDAQMIMMHSFPEPALVGWGDRREPLIIEVSRSNSPRRVSGERPAPALDDHRGSLGAVEVEVLSGLWLVTIRQEAQAGRHFHDLVAAIRALEARRGPGSLEEATTRVSARQEPSLDQLGVVTARHSPGPGGGMIRIAADPPSAEGAVGGPALAAWLGAYLHSRDDLVGGLDEAGEPGRDVFVWVSFGGAPWAVESFLADLRSGDAVLPPIPPPDVPDWAAQVWVSVKYSDTGCRWDGTSWQAFQVRR
jgi:hypothetical protein